MRELYREFVRFFVSLRLTVGLLALSALLVFLATLDQVQLGIWAVQEKWFKSFIVLHEIRGFPVPVFPGGYFIGGLLLVNLVAAHAKRFALTWKKAGIQLVHFGLILLLLGELFTGIFQDEYQLRLNEGQTRNYSESWRHHELAVIDTTSPAEDTVTAIPTDHLTPSASIQVPALPFRLVTRAYYPNAHVMLKEQVPAGQATVENLATTGLGARFALSPVPVTYNPEQKNWPAAFVELIGPEGSLGTYLVAALFTQPESFAYAGRSWQISLRPERAYKDYSLTLLKVTHDVYPGTEIPKNFSSRVRLNTPDGVEDREVVIFMNNPLRYGGLTFYQYQMDAPRSMSVLQVVRNPSWVIPYISCLLMAVGLYWQFAWHLVAYRPRQLAAEKLAPIPVPETSVALGLVLSLRVFAGVVGLWITTSVSGAPATVGLAVVLGEFAVCAALFIGLVSRRSWVGLALRAYAWLSVLLLVAVFSYGFFGGDIYDAILHWLVIGLHSLTAAGLLLLSRRFPVSSRASASAA